MTVEERIKGVKAAVTAALAAPDGPMGVVRVAHRGLGGVHGH